MNKLKKDTLEKFAKTWHEINEGLIAMNKKINYPAKKVPGFEINTDCDFFVYQTYLWNGKEHEWQKHDVSFQELIEFRRNHDQ